MTIDLNCDLGESAAEVADGRQEALMAHITSANIACGGHAGDEWTMQTTLEQTRRWKVAAGAHPGYPDRNNFGRVALKMTPPDVARFVEEQTRALAALAKRCSIELTHIKPHGALYNRAAEDPALAEAIAEGGARVAPGAVFVGLAGSMMLDVFRRRGLRTAAEGFADRRYEADGSLRSRTLPDAVIADPEEAAAQAVRIAVEHIVIASDGSRVPVHAETLCIHGDSPNALRVAEAVARALRGAGVELCAL